MKTLFSNTSSTYVDNHKKECSDGSYNYIKNKLLEEYKAVQLILASEGKYKSTVKRKRSY